MEIDSSLSVLIFAVCAVFYSIVVLVSSSIRSVVPERAQWLVEQAVEHSESLNSIYSASSHHLEFFWMLRVISLTCVILSLINLLFALAGVHWWVLLLSGVIVLVIVGILSLGFLMLAFKFGETVALRTAFIVNFLCRLSGPIFTTKEWVFRMVFATNKGLEGDVMSPELSMSLDPSGELLDEREVRMIRGVVRLDKTTAREIMIPRGDMVAVEQGDSPEQLADKMLESGHSRIPVYEGNLDQINGIAYARDVMAHLSNGGQESNSDVVDGLLRPALFIPETKTLEELLNEFQERRVHISIVVDEYGGVSGLVTIEDLLEEIVGEINDEFDVGEADIVRVGQNEYMVEARVGVDQINDLLNVSIKVDGFDTLGGLVYHTLGRIPGAGERFEYEGLDIEVVTTIGRRLKRLRIIQKTTDD